MLYIYIVFLYFFSRARTVFNKIATQTDVIVNFKNFFGTTNFILSSWKVSEMGQFNTTISLK